ncbi:hypothetical protein GA0115254_12384 [Streptomyces sp. Ncost-T10-10d]|nr:hypothetical protein GA0115254_12384 [Streptomyces sp. Ncost-T10-10d]
MRGFITRHPSSAPWDVKQIRDLLLRPVGGGGPTVRRALGQNDLIVMGGSCQRTWDHAIPKSARASGLGISLQFRPDGVR